MGFLWQLPIEVLRALLKDHTTGRNIVWATKDYERQFGTGIGFGEGDEITAECLVDREHPVIRPRTVKAAAEQRQRSVEKGEVFTPSWVCNQQNNLVDAAWFGTKTSPFNVETVDRKTDQRGWKRLLESYDRNGRHFIYFASIQDLRGSKKLGGSYLKNEAEEEKGRAALREFLNFCPVLAMEGGRARPYDAHEMMRRLKHVFVMKAIRNGFADPSIYNNDKLMKLGKVDLMKFDGLMGIVGKSKQTQSLNSVDLAWNGLDEEVWERRKGEEEKRKGCKLSPEEEVAKKQSETNGQAPRKSIFHLFQMAADKISTGYVSLIYPAIRWIHRSGKDMADFGLMQINDTHLMRIDFYPDSQEVFTSVAIADGISMVCKDMRKTSPGFLYAYHKCGKTTAVEMANPGSELMSLNPHDGSVLRKVRAVVGENGMTMLGECVMPRSLFGIESEFVEKNPKLVKPYDGKTQLAKDEIKLFTNDRAGKAGRAKWYVVKRAVIASDNRKYIDEWQVIVSSANAGGRKRDWQLSICDNRSAFGRARVGLSSFKTKDEAEHFHAYCKTYLIRFLFLMTDESLTSLAKAVPDFRDYSDGNGKIDFSKDLNAQLYSLIGLTKAEQQHVEKRVKDLDASRNRH